VNVAVLAMNLDRNTIVNCFQAQGVRECYRVLETVTGCWRLFLRGKEAGAWGSWLTGYVIVIYL
jgi:hypothetical protein